jgi:hypothetical protein
MQPCTDVENTEADGCVLAVIGIKLVPGFYFPEELCLFHV